MPGWAKLRGRWRCKSTPPPPGKRRSAIPFCPNPPGSAPSPARAEIEFDDGGVLRLGPDSLAELSDYTRLSTGQGVTLLSLDRGLAYFTGAAGARDSLVLAVPGAQITIRRGARVRLEARESSSLVSIIEGAVRVSCPAAELDLKEGRTIRVEPANTARFYLFNEVAGVPTDGWNEERDKALAATASA